MSDLADDVRQLIEDTAEQCPNKQYPICTRLTDKPLTKQEKQALIAWFNDVRPCGHTRWH